jgi:hypothetical protein
MEMNFNWHVPLIFSLFKDLRVIMKLITSIFLEKSIIFISKYPVRLSSAILGLKSLINPFNWSFSLIPILPAALLEYIESPLPILCGITYESHFLLTDEYKLEMDFVDSFTWVYLDYMDEL